MKDITRRRLLRSTAGGLTGLALGAAAFEPLALALAPSPKPTKAELKKRIAQLEKTAPAGSSSGLQPKLDAKGEKLTQLLVHKSRHAFALAATNPTAKFAKGSLHAVAAKHLAKLTPKRVARVKAQATKLMAAPTATKTTTFGPYKDASLASATVKAATDIELTSVLRELVVKKSESTPNQDKPEDEDEPKFTRMEFQLNSVKCKEKNDSWVSGADELLIGGTLIARGTVSTINRIKYSDFDEGEKLYKDYELCEGMPTELVTGNPLFEDWCPHGGPDDVYAGRKIIGADMKGPGTYALYLVLGEEDIGGGFTEMINDIYDALSKEIQAALDDLGIAVGAILSSYLGPIGEFIGVVLGKALGALLDWLMNDVINNKDDFIAAETWTIELAKRTKSYVRGLWSDPLPTPNHTFASSMKKIEFKGKDNSGHYIVRLHWRAFET